MSTDDEAIAEGEPKLLFRYLKPLMAIFLEIDSHNPMSEPPTPEQLATWQRRLASRANNRAWTLAEVSSRTPDEDEEMLQAANAAMYFWNIVGNTRNHARAAQLLAHVYALLGLGDLAKHYLARSNPVFFGEGAEPLELAFAHAIAANVAAATSDSKMHGTHYAEAERLMAALSNEQDRNTLGATLRVIPVPSAESRSSS